MHDIICVVVFDGRVMVYTSGCSDSAWNLFSSRSWCWNIHFETKKQSQKWEDRSLVHFSVRWSWIILLSADCCLSQ